MKESFIIGKRIFLKDVDLLNWTIIDYIIPQGKNLEIKKYFIESNIQKEILYEMGIILRKNGMLAISINSVENNQIPLLEGLIKFDFKAAPQDRIKIELQQKKFIDVKSIALIADASISDLWIAIYFFGELVDKE